MKSRKNQLQFKTKPEKSCISGGHRSIVGEEPDREIYAVSEFAVELRDDFPVRGFGEFRERSEMVFSEDVSKYLQEGWKLGRIYRKKD